MAVAVAGCVSRTRTRVSSRRGVASCRVANKRVIYAETELANYRTDCMTVNSFVIRAVSCAKFIQSTLFVVGLRNPSLLYTYVCMYRHICLHHLVTSVHLSLYYVLSLNSICFVYELRDYLPALTFLPYIDSLILKKDYNTKIISCKIVS